MDGTPGSATTTSDAAAPVNGNGSLHLLADLDMADSIVAAGGGVGVAAGGGGAAGDDAPNSRPKEAACLVCRRSKVKCERDLTQTRCKRCIQSGSECVRPAFHVGRQKGIKNKRKGLDKALYQIEQALKRARSGEQTTEDDKALIDLQSLLESATKQPSPSKSSGGGGRPARRRRLDSGAAAIEMLTDSSDDDSDSPRMHISPGRGNMSSSIPDRQSTNGTRQDENLPIDDAENPLQLLARASDLQLSPKLSTGRGSSISTIPIRTVPSRETLDEMTEVQSFFTSIRVGLDVGDDIDPVCMGLVTDDEADALFQFFHKNLAHTRWGLDPLMYTPAFTRSRSAFLFTSIMAASALFIPTAGALSKRLSNHVKTLAHRVLVQRHRSVEIVLAFMVNVPWMFPGKHSTDDETCWYVAMATTIAIDLSLHKILLPADAAASLSGNARGLVRGDCLDPGTALALDGFADVEPTSELGKRLLRRRERCWIALFVLERGMCLARGRSYTVPITHLIRECDSWHRSPAADPQDGHLVSMAVLRRDLDGLFSSVRSLCDGSRNIATDGSLIAQSIQSTIEKFFEQWLTDWGISIGSGPQRRLPPYVEILVTHTRLSTYSGVINHPTAPPEVRHFFRTAGLSSALSVMRAAIQGEAQLQSMPNNTVIMIGFAASFALRLSAQVTGNSNLAPSIRTLIEEVAGVLERIGSTTKHRNGMSALHGRYLRHVVRKVAIASEENIRGASAEPSLQPRHTNNQTLQQQQPQPQSLLAPRQVSFNVNDPMVSQAPTFVGVGAPLWSEPIQFSSMSDDQIVEALNTAGNEFDLALHNMPWEEAVGFDWMNWSYIPDLGGF